MTKLRIEEIEASQELKEKAFLKFLIEDAGSFSREFIFANDLYGCVKDFFRSNERMLFFDVVNATYKNNLNIDIYKKLEDCIVNEALLEKRGIEQEALKKEYNDLKEFNVNDYDELEIKKFLKKSLKTHLITKLLISNGDAIQTGVEDVQQKVTEQLEKICALEFDTNIGTNYFNDIAAHIERLKKKENRQSFGTEFQKLDQYTYGGIPVDDTCLLVIMAQPGLGKSQFMMNIAANWILADKKVLVLTLEMSEEMYSRRFDALFTDIAVNGLRGREDDLQLSLEKLKKTHKNAELIIKEYATGTMTANMLRQYLEKLKRTKGFVPDLIVVDYLNIMKPNSGADVGLYEKCAKITEELRAISCELKRPLLTATQANRGRSAGGGGYASSDIDLSNVSESSGISATADALFALWRNDNDYENNITHLKILKNRLGGFVGESIMFSVNPLTLKLSEHLDSSGDPDNIDELL